MSDWLFWLILWWAAWFAAFLSFAASNSPNGKPPVNGLIIFFVAVFAGLLPFLIIIGVVVKICRDDK